MQPGFLEAGATGTGKGQTAAGLVAFVPHGGTEGLSQGVRPEKERLRDLEVEHY